MPWGRLDDTLYDHHKVEALPDAIRLACVGLQTLAISWCNRQLTDGFVPDSRVQKLGGMAKHRDALLVVHMWETVPGGIQIHDFLHYNKSKVQVEAERAAARNRMKKHRRSPEVQPNVQANEQRTNGVTSGEVPDSRARSRAYPGPTRPNPDTTPPTPSPARGRRRNASTRRTDYDAHAVREDDDGPTWLDERVEA